MSGISALRRTYVLHACIADEPAIWRRMTVPSDILLADLHAALQIAFDWDDQHLHFFERAGVRYGLADDDESRVEDQSGVRISQLLTDAGETLRYVYDFSNWWEHRIELQHVQAFAAGDVLPRCLDGARAGPPDAAKPCEAHEERRTAKSGGRVAATDRAEVARLSSNMRRTRSIDDVASDMATLYREIMAGRPQAAGARS